MHATRSKRAHDASVLGLAEYSTNDGWSAWTSGLCLFDGFYKSYDLFLAGRALLKEGPSGKKRGTWFQRRRVRRVEGRLWQQLNLFASFNHESTFSCNVLEVNADNELRCVVLIVWNSVAQTLANRERVTGTADFYEFMGSWKLQARMPAVRKICKTSRYYT